MRQFRRKAGSTLSTPTAGGQSVALTRLQLQSESDA